MLITRSRHCYRTIARKIGRWVSIEVRWNRMPGRWWCDDRMYNAIPHREGVMDCFNTRDASRGFLWLIDCYCTDPGKHICWHLDESMNFSSGISRLFSFWSTSSVYFLRWNAIIWKRIQKALTVSQLDTKFEANPAWPMLGRKPLSEISVRISIELKWTDCVHRLQMMQPLLLWQC